jgi:hypothetical protein
MSALVPSIYQNEDNYFYKTANLCKETLMPDTPGWKLGLLKSTVGLAGAYCSNMYNGSYLDLVGELLCSGLFFSGLNDLTSCALSSLPQRATKQKKSIRNRNVKPVKLTDVDKRTKKLMKVITLTAHIGMSLHCLYNYETIGKLGTLTVNPHASSDEVPDSLIQGFQLSVCALSVIMNVLEMMHREEEKFLLDNPVSELVNGVVALNFFGNYKTDKTNLLQGIDDTMSHILKLNEGLAVHSALLGGPILNNQAVMKFYTKRYLRNAFVTNFLENFYQLISNNVTSYKIENSRFKKIDSTSSLNHPHVIKPQKTYSKKIGELSNHSIEYPVFYDNSSYKEEKTPLKKEKVKTKGIANKYKKDLNPPKNKLIVAPSSSLTTDPRKFKREKALDRLAILRESHPVKEMAIEKEIKKAMKFAQAHKVSGTGSIYSIKWETDKGLHSLNYEEPHGVDGTNYAGNKLDRVLNVLFTIYISDLNAEQATKYITKYNPSLFNFNFIKYLFFNRSSK